MHDYNKKCFYLKHIISGLVSIDDEVAQLLGIQYIIEFGEC